MTALFAFLLSLLSLICAAIFGVMSETFARGENDELKFDLLFMLIVTLFSAAAGPGYGREFKPPRV